MGGFKQQDQVSECELFVGIVCKIIRIYDFVVEEIIIECDKGVGDGYDLVLDWDIIMWVGFQCGIGYESQENCKSQMDLVGIVNN